MKILNLDSLVKVTKSVVIDGVSHDVADMTVEDFLLASKEAETLEANGGATVVENLEASVRHVNRVIPTLSAQRLEELSMAQLGALVAFVNSAVSDSAAGGEPDKEEAGNAQG